MPFYPLKTPRKAHMPRAGFTLIEMTIVIAIIGLVIGGVFVGRDMLNAAAIQAQVVQIGKFQSAVTTFRNKFSALPGDIIPADVTQFGFTVVPTRTGTAGRGNGDGWIQGYYWGSGTFTNGLTSGEAAWFWEDLSSNADLIEGKFTYAADAAMSTAMYNANVFKTLLPPAKIGGGNFICVVTDGLANYFSLGLVTLIDTNGALRALPGLTVTQAAAIDQKMDDGLPQTGNVLAKFENWGYSGTGTPNGVGWASGVKDTQGTADTTATAASTTTCYDNGGVAGTQKYSLQQRGGSGVNCGLTFKFSQ